MKIVYSAGNHTGAKYLISDFIAHTCDEVRIAAYNSATSEVNSFHWTLDGFPSPEYEARLLSDITEYAPDLAIVDYEPIVANIANQLEIPIIYCSPIHLLDGLQWHRSTRQHTSLIEKHRTLLKKYPDGLKLIYSPFEITSSFLTNTEFQWVVPYHRVSSPNKGIAIVVDTQREDKFKSIFHGFDYQFCVRHDEYYNQSEYIVCEGQTAIITDCLASGKKLILTPHFADLESTLNSDMISALNLGKNLGQLELLGRLGRNDLEQCIENFEFGDAYPAFPPNAKMLHERIAQL